MSVFDMNVGLHVAASAPPYSWLPDYHITKLPHHSWKAALHCQVKACNAGTTCEAAVAVILILLCLRMLTNMLTHWRTPCSLANDQALLSFCSMLVLQR